MGVHRKCSFGLFLDENNLSFYKKLLKVQNHDQTSVRHLIMMRTPNEKFVRLQNNFSTTGSLKLTIFDKWLWKYFRISMIFQKFLCELSKFPRQDVNSFNDKLSMPRLTEATRQVKWAENSADFLLGWPGSWLVARDVSKRIDYSSQLSPQPLRWDSQFNFVTRVHILSLADPKRKITQIKNKKIPTHLFFIPFYLCVHRLGFLDTKEGLSPIDSGVNNI